MVIQLNITNRQLNAMRNALKIHYHSIIEEYRNTDDFPTARAELTEKADDIKKIFDQLNMK